MFLILAEFMLEFCRFFENSFLELIL